MPRLTSAGRYRRVGGFCETSSPSVASSATFPVEETDAPGRTAFPTYGNRHATGVLPSSVPSGEGTPGERTTEPFAEGGVPVTPGSQRRCVPAWQRNSHAPPREIDNPATRDVRHGAGSSQREPAASTNRVAAGGAAPTGDSCSEWASPWSGRGKECVSCPATSEYTRYAPRDAIIDFPKSPVSTTETAFHCAGRSPGPASRRPTSLTRRGFPTRGGRMSKSDNELWPYVPK